VLEPICRGIACELDGDAVGRGDPDQRGAADRQAADRICDLLGGLEPQPALMPGKLALIEGQQRPAIERERGGL
jgi:hypothetical protein